MVGPFTPVEVTYLAGRGVYQGRFHALLALVPFELTKRNLSVVLILFTSQQEVAAEASRTYGRDDMCGAPASTNGFHDPGLLHSAVLKGLTPGQPYE